MFSRTIEPNVVFMEAIVGWLATLPLLEFERAVRSGKIAFLGGAFGIPRGYLVRRVRELHRLWGQ